MMIRVVNATSFELFLSLGCTKCNEGECGEKLSGGRHEKEGQDTQLTDNHAADPGGSTPTKAIDGFQTTPLATFVPGDRIHEDTPRQRAGGIHTGRTENVQDTDHCDISKTPIGKYHGQHEGNAHPLEEYDHSAASIGLGPYLHASLQIGIQEGGQNVQDLDLDGGQVQIIDKENGKVPNRHATRQTRTHVGQGHEQSHTAFALAAATAKE